MLRFEKAEEHLKCGTELNGMNMEQIIYFVKYARK